MLEVKNLTVYYDKAIIIREVSIKVATGEMIGIVGPNGAGKTTLLRAITGLVRWDQYRFKWQKNITMQGIVLFNGERIDMLLPHKIAQMGLTHCPERRRLFGEMTVKENLKAGAYLCKDKKQVEENLKKVYELFPALKTMENRVAKTLSGGEQQMLAIGRALMINPKLLCIDEPSIGLAPKVRRTVFEELKEIHRSGVTIILVEQDVKSTFKITDRNYVISQGRIIAEGTAEELLKDETIRQAYLGL
jgi:branched-chain amino acid transport system ATP-binding protein